MIIRRYEYHENTSGEIKDAVLERLENFEKYEPSDLQNAFNKARFDHLKLTFEATKDINPRETAVLRYHLAAFLAAEGGLGRKFLEQNWLENSRNYQLANV